MPFPAFISCVHALTERSRPTANGLHSLPHVIDLITHELRYNLHPGSTRGELSLDEGLRLVAESVNWAHERTAGVTVVLENTAGGGYTIGRSFDELGKIIAMVKDKSRVGVCLGSHLISDRTPEALPHAGAQTRVTCLLPAMTCVRPPPSRRPWRNSTRRSASSTSRACISTVRTHTADLGVKFFVFSPLVPSRLALTRPRRLQV